MVKISLMLGVLWKYLIKLKFSIRLYRRIHFEARIIYLLNSPGKEKILASSLVRSEDRMQDPKSEADANNILRL